MLGSLTSALGYWLVLGILVLWMVVRVWRSRPLLAVGVFLFWPLALVALLTEWGNKESDVRVPFLLSLVALGMMFFMVNRAVDQGVHEVALALTDEDIALIREDDPELAIQLEMARAEAMEQQAAEGGDGDSYAGPPPGDSSYAADEGDSEGADAGAGAVAAAATGGNAPPAVDSASDAGVAAPLATPVERDIGELAAAHRQSLKLAEAGVSWRFGKVPLAAGAVLHVPDGFRFAPRDTLVRLAHLKGLQLPEPLAGWLVHRRVDLARGDAWWVEVERVPLARTPTLPQAGHDDASSLDGAAYAADLASLVDGTRELPGEPRWDADAGVASWRRGGSAAAGNPADGSNPADGNAAARFTAAVPLDGAALAFHVRGMAAEHHELARRAVRLMAGSTRPE